MTIKTLDLAGSAVVPCPRQDGIDSLLVSVGAGDRKAFAALYDSLSPTVYAMSLCEGNDLLRSAEVTQDVFVRAWQRARSYEPTSGSAWAWIQTITREAMHSRP